MQDVSYINVVESPQYLVGITTADMASNVAKLAWFNSKAKHMLRYCKGTMDYKLKYRATDGPLEY
jgi:hypothetical protein